MQTSATPEFETTGAVASLQSPQTFTSPALEAFASGWFTGGRLEWTSGANAGFAVRIVRHAGVEIEAIGALKAAIALGDTFVATAGCDKAFTTCREKFTNASRFRGFPHMPGPEAVLAGPAAGQPNDGGRR
jgi:uncharacterized phage protein (TIGR02218 family)